MWAALNLLVAAGLVAAVTGAVGCGRTGAPATPPAPPPVPTPTPVDPQALLRESGRRMEELESFHFHLDHRSGGTPLLPNLIIQEAQGDVIKPDKLSTLFSGTFGGFVIRSSLITLGEASYMTNPLTGQWEGVPRQASPLGFFNPREGIAAMMRQVEEASLLPEGGGVHRLKGRLPAEALAPLVGGTVKGTTVSVELRIDAAHLYLLEAVFEGRVTPTEADGVVRVIRLSRFNEPLSIVPPQ